MTVVDVGKSDQTASVEGEQTKPVQGTIRMQDENTILASDLLGADIYNAAGEKVGEVDDAIVSLDGNVEGVVIGVGGFLGIGQKNVAVEMAQISVQMDENNDPQLVLDTTRDALKAAPEFQTAEDQRSGAQSTAAGTAPATGMAPAGGTAPAGMPPAGGAAGTTTEGGAASGTATQ